MTEQDFIFKSNDITEVENGSLTWQSPSNIALVKYWGKRDPQIPENTSISFTLNNCHTITTLSYVKHSSRLVTERSRSDVSESQNDRTLKQVQSDEVQFDIYFEGQKNEDFKPKIATFF